jgi:DNA-directed RNA polymerase subunit M/transcription elongation factor TFIIS
MLTTSTQNDNLTFKCGNCFTVYNSEPDDTLIYEESPSSNILIYQTILAEAVNDPVNIKEKINCPKCKHYIAKSVRLGNEMRIIYICEKCNFQWIEV